MQARVGELDLKTMTECNKRGGKREKEEERSGGRLGKTSRAQLGLEGMLGMHVARL